MKATAEPLEGNKVKLSVEVDDDTFEEALSRAAKAIAREVRIPGFRPGKVPRKVLEKRVGTEALREQAIRDALPEYFAQAAIDTDTDAIAPPEIDITSGKEDGPLHFTATVEIRPVVEVPGYADLTVTVPSPEVSQDEVDAQIDRMRERIGSRTEPVDRPATTGDRVTIDIRGTHDGEQVPGLTADGYSYEVGSGGVVPELDETLVGASAGDELAFEAPVPNDPDAEPLQLEVKVVEVTELVLPDATDEWAADASEFETLAELRADITETMTNVKRTQSILAVRSAVVDALAGLVAEDPPEAMVDFEMQERLHQLHHRLESQGATLQQYFQSLGQSPEEIQEELRETAVSACKADLALRALVTAEALEATDDDLAAEIRKAAERSGQDPDDLREALEHNDRVPEVRSDIAKSKAVDWLIANVTLQDDNGNPIDRSLLDDPAVAEEPVIEPEHDHDHDHDH